MAPKKKNKGRGRRSKTPAQTSASDPNPTTTSPSTSAPTGGATTTSLVPSSTFPSAPPTTTTTTQVIPSAPPQPTSLLPSSTSQITTTQPLPSAPPLSIQKTHQERTSCTSDCATATHLASPSTAPSASAESTRTPTLLPVTRDFMRLFGPAVAGALAAAQSVKEEDTAGLQTMVVALFGLQLDEMESVVGSLVGLANEMKGEVELKIASETLANMGVIKSAVGVVEKLLAEKLFGDTRNPDGSGGSCGGSEGESGAPDSGPDSGPDGGSGEGDGEGGEVSTV